MVVLACWWIGGLEIRVLEFLSDSVREFRHAAMSLFNLMAAPAVPGRGSKPRLLGSSLICGFFNLGPASPKPFQPARRGKDAMGHGDSHGTPAASCPGPRSHPGVRVFWVRRPGSVTKERVQLKLGESRGPLHRFLSRILIRRSRS